MKTHETKIPFTGFYESIHNDALDACIDQISMNNEGVENFDLQEVLQNGCKWQGVFKEYAKEYAGRFADELSIKIKFKELNSPKFYNYSTDSIEVEISEKELKRIYADTDKPMLGRWIKEALGTRSGFIPFYSNDLNEWPDDVTQWEYSQIAILLEVYTEQKLAGWSDTGLWNVEHKIIDDMQGNGELNNMIYNNLSGEAMQALDNFNAIRAT